MKITYNFDQLPLIAKNLLERLPDCKVYTFTGPLGAGKTSLVREMLRQLGIKGPVASPTFTYVNVYENHKGQTFYHFDLYRITSADDFIAAGFDEYLYQPNTVCFIEWPEPILSLLKDKVCHVNIDYAGEERELRYEVKD